ncbi:MAG: hypothetical protein SOZ80_01965 [Prevotella sp.]|uniref:hypothetical protein n=1 Tax=Prevotella sp. TaxID=59823 RepID=UPI002A302F9D|nr:hypothetical protein [Prevotella sp.]MDD7317436.1 hypothetical protein [Prevotellaceae bacterium]MDY4019534.1 hypothetical protein [Prevotella sp.]
MLHINLKTVALVAIGMLLTVGLGSCANDPEEPNNEIHDKLHEDPVKMTVQLVECHLHSDWNKIQEQGGPHQNPESPAKFMKKVQEVSYELDKDKGWIPSKGSQKGFFVIRSGDYRIENSFTPAPVYLVFINYYNAKGELINGEFMTNGQENIHQHFFTAENITRATSRALKLGDKVMDYLYVDTDPWDKTVHGDHAKLIGKTNPIGFKGVVRFMQSNVKFDLRIRLYHGYKSKIDPKTKTFSPFDDPAKVLIQRGTWDVNMSIPVVVYLDRETDLDGDNELVMNISDDTDLSTIPEDSLDKEGNRIVHQIMDAFGISWREALEEYVDYTYRGGDVEAGGIWL